MLKKLMAPFTYVCLIAALSFSCSTDGDPGPAGPQGEQGADGAAGTDGADGADGIDGTDGKDAMVNSTEWLPITFPTNTGYYSYVDFDDDHITSEVMDQSIILVYGKDQNNHVRQFPFILHEINENYYYVLMNETKTIRFVGRSIDGSSEVFDLFKEVRYVILSNSNPANGRVKTSDYAKMSYKEVMDHFGLAY